MIAESLPVGAAHHCHLVADGPEAKATAAEVQALRRQVEELEQRLHKRDEQRRAMIHIMGELNNTNKRLADQRKAMLHILGDYEEDRRRLGRQTERLDNSRRALLHILQDVHQTNLRLENSRKAMIHIMGDLRETTEAMGRREQELREKQDQLVQAAKLATLGELTTGVAHELNNPLNNIGLFVGNAIDLLEMKADDRPAILRYLNNTMLQVRKATEIISHLRTFGRVAHVSRIPVAIKEAILRSISLMQEQLRLRQIQLDLDLPEDDGPQVIGNAIRLEQVFINLLTNARDAVAESERKDDRHFLPGGKGRDRPAVSGYRARDSGGAGRADFRSVFYDQRSRLRHGAGTFDHLWDHHRSRRHDFRPEPARFGRGVSDSTAFGEPQNRDKSRLGGGEMSASRILIVDDDPALLTALSGALKLRLPEIVVETCDSALAAVKKISASDYDAVVSDIKMPGMDGLALLKEIRMLRPELPTLLITGHGQHDLAVQALRGGAFDFIQKPIDRDYVVAALTRALQMRKMTRQLQEQQKALANHAAELEQAVEDRTEELRLANRRKDEFIATLSHELRNPLAPIRSGLEILQMEAAGNGETIGLIQEQLRHLVRLVDDLLDTSRIMQGKVELRKEAVELVVLIDRSIKPSGR